MDSMRVDAAPLAAKLSQATSSGSHYKMITAGRMPVYRLGAHGQARRGDYSAVRDALRWMAMAGKEGV